MSANLLSSCVASSASNIPTDVTFLFKEKEEDGSVIMKEAKAHKLWLERPLCQDPFTPKTFYMDTRSKVWVKCCYSVHYNEGNMKNNETWRGLCVRVQLLNCRDIINLLRYIYFLRHIWRLHWKLKAWTGYIADTIHSTNDFWHKRSALQMVAVRRSTGNDISGPLFSPLFSIFHSIFFSPSRPFLIERMLGS